MDERLFLPIPVPALPEDPGDATTDRGITMKRILSLLVMACLLAFTGACSSKKAPEPEKPHYNPSLAFGATWTRHPVILNGDTQDVLEVVVSSANPGPVVVTGIDINRVITDRMYLMPHVNKNSEDKYWVVEDNVTYTENPIADWVDWMGQEAADSERGTDNEWLTDYEVPNDATTEIAKVSCTSQSMPAATGTEPYPFTEAHDAIYLPESKTVKDESDPSLKDLQLQEYSITVHTKEQATDGTEKEKTYPPQTLPHLASLFRNTHVMVGFIFTDHDIACEVDVIPYSEVILEPDFGL